MKTILSIDFDIIMAPSISIYNDKVPSASWDVLQKEPLYNLTYADLNHYQKLIQIILYLTNFLQEKQVHFIYDHEQIVNYIPKNEQFILWNIDHHHDLGYDEESLKSLENKKVTCANWVKWLFDNHYNVIQYYWIKNENSLPCNEKSQSFLNITDDFRTVDINKLLSIRPDELIICLSSPWIPPHIRSLFFIFMDICNRIYDTHYEIETIAPPQPLDL